MATLACAVYARDEQTCVAVGRFFMRNYQLSADSSRIFASLCRLCQAPVAWYSSGPAQKYILRQIRLVDQVLVREGHCAPNSETEQLSMCLNMLYGSILFTSTSYTYALSMYTYSDIAVVFPFFFFGLTDNEINKIIFSELMPFNRRILQYV